MYVFFETEICRDMYVYYWINRGFHFSVSVQFMKMETNFSVGQSILAN